MMEIDHLRDKKHCGDLLSNLSEFIDGTLQEELCEKIQEHMDSCENCRVVVDSLRKTIYLYQVTSPAPAVPEAVRERLYRRLDLEQFLK